MDEKENIPIAPHARSTYICERIKEYVEDPGNFKETSKSISEIAVELGFPYSTVSRNFQLMFFRGDFTNRVKMSKTTKRILVDNRG